MLLGLSRANQDSPLPEPLLPPKQAKEAYKQSLSQFKSKQQKVTYFNYRFDNQIKQFEVVCLTDGDQLRVFVIDKANLLGKGGQGDVYLAQEIYPDSNTAKMVVAKVSSNPIAENDFKNEAEHLRKFARFNGYSSLSLHKSHYYYLFSKFCPGKTLIDLCYENRFGKLIKRNDLDPIFILRVAKAIMAEVQRLHQTFGVLHRDIKSDNIIIQIKGDDIIVHLVDFGNTCLIRKADKTFSGTLGYQGPEFAPHKRDQRPVYSISAEYYSLGIVFAELISHCNFQWFLQTAMKEMAEKQSLKYIPHQDILQAMPDVFQAPSINENHIDPPWRVHMCEIAKMLCAENANARPTFNDIYKMINRFDKIILEYQKNRQTPRSAREQLKYADHELDEALNNLLRLTLHDINDQQVEKPLSASDSDVTKRGRRKSAPGGNLIFHLRKTRSQSINPKSPRVHHKEQKSPDTTKKRSSTFTAK